MKTFTLEQVLDLLVSMQQGITPELFEGSKDLGTEDFLDLPLCKATQLDIKIEFIEYINKQKDLISKF